MILLIFVLPKEVEAMDFTPEPITILLRLIQPLKALLIILITLLGIVKVDNYSHPPNSPSLIDSTLFPIYADVIFLQLLKAELPIEVTFSGTKIEVRPLQPEKAELRIEVTLSGIVIDVMPLQP